ncbi:hypothetical protein IEQ34_004313 [Dendrobium chrysotoxum]|uniref:Protein kinase domain-containing protein n=1 Tax=Dendrobium chrysotoxum TaxID=161865 RepID=A0AAV7HI24_DENCH|nr:hypothetical protein IEQ34_004313 [Dendrobium chrysotoxum]
MWRPSRRKGDSMERGVDMGGQESRGADFGERMGESEEGFEDEHQICHRDLKLENTFLDGSPAPRLKICDFGYSKVSFSFSD